MLKIGNSDFRMIITDILSPKFDVTILNALENIDSKPVSSCLRMVLPVSKWFFRFCFVLNLIFLILLLSEKCLKDQNRSYFRFQNDLSGVIAYEF